MSKMFLSHLPEGRNESTGRHIGANQLINEQEIIAASKNDPTCFKPLYTYYYKPILHYICHRTNDINESADIASSVFYKAIIHLPKYKYRDLPFGAWLYRIAYNETMQYFRSRKKLRVIVLDDLVINNLAEELPGDDKAILLKAVISALDHLEPADTEIIDLKYFQQQSNREIAFILGITEGNLKVRSHRIIKRIKKIISDKYGTL